MINFFLKYSLFLSCVACIGFTQKENPNYSYQYTEADYMGHLSYLEELYLKINGHNIAVIDGPDLLYFQKIINKLVLNNEFILKKNRPVPQLYVVNDSRPFHFALPGPHVYISTALLLKYIKSEKIFISILAFDLIKCLNNLYYKKILVPIGYVSSDTFLRITQLSGEYNKEISKWTYVVLKRSGNDPVAFLNWLQIQNKNPAEFRATFDDQRYIFEMESSYKSFLVEKEKNTKLSDEAVMNSSKGFYSLLDKIKRRKT